MSSWDRDQSWRAEGEAIQKERTGLVRMGQQEFGDENLSDEEFNEKVVPLRYNEAVRSGLDHMDESLNVPQEQEAWTASRSDIMVNVDSRNVPSVMQEGLKTQHETGTSNGTYDPSERDRWESNAFGPSVGITEPRPVYGYMSGGMEPTAAPSHLIEYGDVALKLSRQQFAPVTTMTRGDSLGSDAAPASIQSNYFDPDEIRGQDFSVFHEAQIHERQIGWNGQGIDSASINLGRGSKKVEQAPDNVKKGAWEALTQRGVPVTSSYIEETSQPEMFPEAGKLREPNFPEGSDSRRSTHSEQWMAKRAATRRESLTRETRMVPLSEEETTAHFSRPSSTDLLDELAPNFSMSGRLGQPERP